MERNFHSAILYKQKLIIFGGKENGYLNDVHEFNIQTEKWSRIITNSNENQPTPRYGHTAVLWQDNMYVYGGYDNEGFCDNNMYTLDLVTNHWLPKHQLPTIPERFHHTSELFPDTGLLLIIGGCNHKKQALKSVFEINLNNYTVRECSPLPEARFGHCSYNTFGNIYIAGGCDYEYDNNTLLLREENEEWKIVEGKPFENGCVFGTVSITQNGPLVIGGIRRNKFRRLANIDEYYKQLCMNHAVPRNDKPFGIPKEIELPKSEFDLNVKIVFVGDRGVGCWTLEHAVLWGNFKIKAEYIPVCYGNNYFSVMYGGQPVGYTLWNSTAYEKNLRVMSYPDTDVFLVCFSVVDPESFKNALSVWLPEVRENAPDAQYILCGTKFDLREDGQTIDELHRSGQDSIPTDIGSLAAKECGCAGYIECSAKQMRGIRAVPSSAISVAVQRYSQHNSEAVKTRGCKTQ